MTAEEYRECLQTGLDLLEALRKLTAKQIVCVEQNELRGLRRLMRERDKLFHALMTVGDRMCSGGNGQLAATCAGMAKTMAAKQQEVLRTGREAVQLMVAERNRTATELRRIREREQVASHYVRYWIAPRPGDRVNEAR